MRFLSRILKTGPALILLTFVLAILASLPSSFGFPRDTIAGVSMLSASAVLFFFLVPAFIVRVIYKESLTTYGYNLPPFTKKTGFRVLLAFLLLLVPLLFLIQNTEFQSFYALGDIAPLTVVLFLGPVALLYYLAEEFLFRGFLLSSLFARFGFISFPILAGLFGVLHAGKPFLEMFYAVYATLILSWLAYVTRSFLPAALLHWLIALIFTLTVSVLFPTTAGSLRL